MGSELKDLHSKEHEILARIVNFFKNPKIRKQLWGMLGMFCDVKSALNLMQVGTEAKFSRVTWP